LYRSYVAMAVQLYQQIERLPVKPPLTLGIMAGRLHELTPGLQPLSL
jgi:hypothetical protein